MWKLSNRFGFLFFGSARKEVSVGVPELERPESTGIWHRFRMVPHLFGSQHWSILSQDQLKVGEHEC